MLNAYHWPGNVRELHHQLESAVLLSGDLIDGQFLPNPQRDARRQRDGNGNGTFSTDFSNGPVSLEGVERQLLVGAMEAAKHNVSQAAQLLCVSRDTMRYRLEKHSIPHKRNGESL